MNAPPSLLTLARRRDPLASPRCQVQILETTAAVPAFGSSLEQHDLAPLRAAGVEVLQINVGKLCNQTCGHCHVDAGPDRREIMTRETMELCLAALSSSAIPTVDITGGAPELCPHFRWLVEQCRALDCRVMDRCNLSVLLLAGQEDLGGFLAENQVDIVASLPYYLEDETDRQRGTGVFRKSIEALRLLNELGYGREGTGLTLDLVTNPVGAYLPPPQEAMEREYRHQLGKRHGIVFNNLYTITNMPISRFLEFLRSSGNYERYMERLVQAFNPAAVAGLMCRTTLSVGWDGRLYDCDFNQMLEVQTGAKRVSHIADFDATVLGQRQIVTGKHCYGCTAGAGSSCGGAIA